MASQWENLADERRSRNGFVSSRNMSWLKTTWTRNITVRWWWWWWMEREGLWIYKKKYVQQKTLYYPSYFIIAIWPTPREYVSMMMMMTTCIFLTIIYLSDFIEGCVALCCFLLRISGQWIIKSSHKIDEKTISLSLLVVFIELSKHRFIFFFLNTLVSLCLVVEVVW